MLGAGREMCVTARQVAGNSPGGVLRGLCCPGRLLSATLVVVLTYRCSIELLIRYKSWCRLQGLF